MVVSSSLYRVRCRCGRDQLPSRLQAGQQYQDNPGDTFFVATPVHVVSELVTGNSAKATLYPLLGDQVQLLEKRVKYRM